MKITKSRLFTYLEVLPYAIIPLIWLVPLDLPSSLAGDVTKAVIVTIAKDLLSALAFLLIVVAKGKTSSMISILKSRAGLYAAIAGLFGGPIGYVLFNSAFFYAGASYGHIFTSLEPVILAISGILIFKRKHNYKLWIGIALVTISISCLVFGSAFHEANWKHILIGAFLGIAGAASWALESILFDKAFDYVDQSKTYELLAIKTTFAIIFGLVVMMPMMSSIATGSGAKAFEVFGSIFTTPDLIWRFFTAGVLIIIGRYMYFYAINNEGSLLVSIVYNLTIIVTPILVLLWYAITKDWIDDSVQGQRGWVLLGISVPLIIGVIMVVINNPIIERKNSKA